jgi:CO dehydrogenase/acetyl-CoA synthase beta subunit
VHLQATAFLSAAFAAALACLCCAAAAPARVCCRSPSCASIAFEISMMEKRESSLIQTRGRLECSTDVEVKHAQNASFTLRALP